MKPNSETIQKIITLWGLSDNIKFVRKVENWIYQDEKNNKFIRVSDSEHRTIKQIESELHWLNYLRSESLNVVSPVKSIKDHFVERVKQEDDYFLVTLYEKVEGTSLMRLEDFTRKRVLNWGKTIGSLHQKTIEYKGHKPIEPRFHWDDEGNFFVDKNDELILIDFDDCHYNWFIYDLAVAIFSLRASLLLESNHEEIKKIEKTLVEGYKTSGPLSDEWFDGLENFVLYRHFILYNWSLKHLDKKEMDEKSKKGVKDFMLKSQKYLESFEINNLLEK